MQSTQKCPEVKKKLQKQGDPVDAEELTRRLTAYLAEQKLKAFKQRNGRFSGARRDWDRSDIRGSGDSTPVLESTTIKQDARRTIHKISESLIKYQRQLENRFNGTIKQKIQQSLSSCSQRSMDSGIVCDRVHDHWDHRIYLSREELEKELCQPRKREFRLKHQFLKSQHSWKNLRVQNQVQITSETKKSSETCLHNKNNTNCLLHNKVFCSNKHSPTQSLKMDLNWVPASNKISRNQSLDDISVGDTFISQPDPKPGLRENIVALFRKNSHI